MPEVRRKHQGNAGPYEPDTVEGFGLQKIVYANGSAREKRWDYSDSESRLCLLVNGEQSAFRTQRYPADRSG